MRSVIGEITLDIGPGAKIRIAAGSCPGMVVGVKVGPGMGLSVGSGVSVRDCWGVRAIVAVSVPEMFAESAVRAMNVGRYSGGYGVGAEVEAGDAKGEQPAKNPRSEVSRIKFRFMQYKMLLLRREERGEAISYNSDRFSCEGDCFVRLKPSLQ